METLQFTSNVFWGEDTYGTHVEVAVNVETGKWFCRFKKFNGYGMGWTKWEETKAPDVYINEWDQEAIKWGWNELKGTTAKRKLP